jgi:stage III sporulation protein SpoIIIAA
MMVASRAQQAGVLVQAVQNHNPNVIIVDKVGTKAVSVVAAWPQMRTVCRLLQRHILYAEDWLQRWRPAA